MTENAIFDLTRETVWIAVVISAPLLVSALVVGIVVGLFQALSSIQEMTLTFVPKVCVMILVFWVSMSFMTGTLVAFFDTRVLPMIEGG